MTTQLQFTKMHGLGNDFMMINAIDQTVSLSPAQIKQLANRHTGIGFDQLLVVEPNESDKVDFTYRIFNADGGEVEQCGNGARCFAKFVGDQGLSDKNELTVQTKTTTMQLKIQNDGLVSVSMGQPQISDVQIDLPYPHTVLSLGNPHIVLQVEQHNTQEIAEIGQALQNHHAFPGGINVGFMIIDNPNTIKLRVFERGAGETHACGSGACAAVVAGITHDQLANQVKVLLLGGECEVQWNNQDRNGSGSHDHNRVLWLTGPAVKVFEGSVVI